MDSVCKGLQIFFFLPDTYAKVILIHLKHVIRDQALDFNYLLKIVSGYFSHLLKMLINLPFH